MMQRYAVKSAKQQSAVWTEVDKSKKALTMNARKITGKEINVEANASPSSLQLALENKDLADGLKQMRAEIAAQIEEAVATAQQEDAPHASEEDWSALSTRELADQFA